LGCTTNQRSIPCGYVLWLLVQGHEGPLLCFLRVFIAEEADGIADKGTGDNTMIDVQTLVKACFFLVINKTSILGTNLRKCWIIILSNYKVLH
jgi:hypothetical protein